MDSTPHAANPPHRRASSGRAAAVAVVVGVPFTALLVWVDFLAAFFIFDWAGGSFGGYGESGRSPAAWAIPAWIIFTLALIALDVAAIHWAYRRVR